MNLKIVSLPTFSKEVKKLHKRYKKITDDLKKLKLTLEKNPKSGKSLGYSCYKIRLANSSVPTGKSGGFRVVYYHLDKDDNIYLMSIYSKTDLENISDEKIAEILKSNGFKI